MPCSICGNRGHNMRTCDRAEFLKDIDPNIFHIRIYDEDNVKVDMEVKTEEVIEDGYETEVGEDGNGTDVDDEDGNETDVEENDEIKTNLLKLLNEYKKSEYKNIEKEKCKNRDQPYAFQNMGDIGEEIALELFPDYLGSGSKGGCAYDLRKEDDNFELIDAKEVKCISLDGSKECNKCKRKCPRFQEICLKCNKSDFKSYSDSRCGISARSHIKYKKFISEYICIVFKYCKESEYIKVECWKIKSDNEYFNDYIENQVKYGKGDTCNCLPGSMDFHLSGPIKLFKIYLYKEKNEIIYYDINNNKYDDIPVKNFNTNNKLGYKYYDSSLNLFKSVDRIDYVNNIHHFKLKSNKSNTHGKNRGIVNRK